MAGRYRYTVTVEFETDVEIPTGSAPWPTEGERYTGGAPWHELEELGVMVQLSGAHFARRIVSVVRQDNERKV